MHSASMGQLITQTKREGMLARDFSKKIIGICAAAAALWEAKGIFRRDLKNSGGGGRLDNENTVGNLFVKLVRYKIFYEY